MVGRAIHSITKEDIDAIVHFIRVVVKETGSKGLVIGASGGLDSAVTTKLCADAIGAENVLNVFMPSAVTPPGDHVLTKDMSKLWGTRYKVIDVQPAIDMFIGMFSSSAAALLEKGNASARCRMMVLYNRAKKLNYLVAGTMNKSEYMMGYFTKFGDGAADLFPIIGLYKTQVWQMAEMIGVPKEVIEKVPTAGLWDGQTDEEEMGITYHDLDIVLNGIILGLSESEIAEDAKVRTSKVLEIKGIVEGMEHKRSAPYRPNIAFNDP
ncbi:MAG: NAD+ synthase [Candidatus Methanoplasma sp.]|jgi:NAD+ synthase|nr:NAD+ synthase [Candidatus Methanoplasma sp.]